MTINLSRAKGTRRLISSKGDVMVKNHNINPEVSEDKTPDNRTKSKLDVKKISNSKD
jgi:hypothetical protein